MGLEGRMKDNLQGTWSSIASFGLSLVLALTSATYIGCKKSPSSSWDNRTNSRDLSGPKTPRQEKTLRALKSAQHLPLWKAEDLQINKYTGAKTAFDYILKEKPLFYTGEMPFRYTSIQRPELLMIAERDPVKLMYDFGDFQTYFVYDDSDDLKGVVAVDKANTVVAEAKVEPVSPNYERVMQEFHYSHGQVIFICTSKVDSLGSKTEEDVIFGKKEKEYFFLVPEM